MSPCTLYAADAAGSQGRQLTRPDCSKVGLCWLALLRPSHMASLIVDVVMPAGDEVLASPFSTATMQNSSGAL